MKFATIALLCSSASATNFDQELNELVGKRLSPKETKKITKMKMEFGEWLEKKEDNFEKLAEKFEDDLGVDHWDEHTFDRYAAPAMRLAKSPEVAMKNAYEEWMKNTPKGKRMQNAIEETGKDFLKGVMVKDIKNLKAYEGFDLIKGNGSYVEWVDNKWAKEIFEDLYEIKESLKAIVEDKKMMKTNMKLGMAVMDNKNVHKMWKFFLEDMKVKNEEELMMKLMATGIKIQKRLKNSPLLKKVEKRFMEIYEYAEKTAKIEDLTEKDMQDYATWWKKNDFQPWI